MSKSLRFFYVCPVGKTFVVGLALLSLRQIYCYLKSKHQKQVPKEYKPIIFDEKELTLENFENILKKHTIRLHDTKIIEEILPREFENEKQLEKISENFIYAKNNQDLLSLTKSLNEPFWDLLDRGGKRWRPALGEFIAETFNKSLYDIRYIAACCELVHNASLVLDDIEDGSEVRRDKPCLHLIYGIDLSINSGSFMNFYPLHYILRNKLYDEKTLNKIAKIFIEEMVHIHMGQSWDIFWHHIARMNGRNITEDQYIQMVAHKTGVLARLITRLTCAVLKISPEITQKLSVFAERIGLAFQIQDDLLNLEPGEKFLKTKGYCGEDIHEGKMSIMVIHSLKYGTPNDSNRLKEILEMKTKDQKLIQEAISLIKKTNSLNYAKDLGNKLISQAWEDIKNLLPDNQGKKKLNLLAEFCMSRNI